MAVLLADRQLSVTARAHPYPRDERGVPIPGADAGETRGPYPGAAKEQPDGSWSLRADVRLLPFRDRDTITDDQGHTWVVQGEPQVSRVPGCAAVDFVRVTGILEPPKVL